MKIIRQLLGALIVGGSRLFPPKKEIHRTPEQKRELSEKLKNHAIYQFVGCPFCVKVRRALTRMDLEVELRNCESGPYREELLQEGGELQVPCLKIVDLETGKAKWMYESSDIISYFEKSFA